MGLISSIATVGALAVSNASGITLSLGGVVFQDFEIPEKMPFGGEQRLIVRKLPGGARVVDAMGPDNRDIGWSGRFRGTSAVQRARLLDFMRVQGQPISLSWGLFLYQVVVKSFDADFQQSYEIPYSISCVVLADAVQALEQAALSFIDAMAGDVLNAVGLGGAVSSTQVNTAVTALATGFSNFQAGVPTATNLAAGATAVASGPLFASLQGSIIGAQTATQGAITTASAPLTSGSVGGVTAGGNPATMASSLSTQASSFGQLDQLYQLSATLGRLSTNTTNAQANGSTVLH